MADKVDICQSEEDESGYSSDTAAFILTELHEILALVLKYLPAKSLNTCARVCKRWEHAVKKVKLKRMKIKWVHYNCTDLGDVEEQLGHHLKELWVEPKAALLFCSTDLNDDTIPVPSLSAAGSSRYPRAAKQEKMILAKYIQRLLPPGCLLRGTATDGIVGTYSRGSTKFGLPIELENSKAASCLLIPQVNGLRIHEFSCGAEIDRLLRGYTSCIGNPCVPTGAVGELTGIPDGEDVKLILLWQTENWYRLPDRSDMGYALLRHYEGKCVIAGGHVDALLPQDIDARTDDDTTSELVCAGVAFCGSALKVASVVLNSSMQSQKHIEDKLQKLKDSHIPTENSIAFMFACIGRGQHFHEQENVESRLFHKLFPHVPLFGFFGNGEIGFEFLPDYSKDNGVNEYNVLGEYPDSAETGYVWGMPDINHSYTTIFVILSLPST